MKIKEWVDKEKDLEELVPDLVKNLTRSLGKIIEILAEVMASEKIDSSDVMKSVEKVQRLEALGVMTLEKIQNGGHTFDFLVIEPSINSIITQKWHTLHCLDNTTYEILQKSVLKTICKLLKHLITLLGLSSLHPKIIKLIKKLSLFCGHQIYTNSLLKALLLAIGNSATDLVSEYLSINKIILKTLDDINLLSCEEKVVLGLCKKNKQKKPGNGHQRRHHKVFMKKTETKKLKQMKEDRSESSGIELICSNVRLITQFIISSPVEKVDLDGFFNLQVQKLNEELKFEVVKMMVYYGILYRKYLKKTRFILQSLLVSIDFRVTCRHLLFILDNLGTS